jgi:hypothetical protein
MITIWFKSSKACPESIEGFKVRASRMLSFEGSSPQKKDPSLRSGQAFELLNLELLESEVGAKRCR